MEAYLFNKIKGTVAIATKQVTLVVKHFRKYVKYHSRSFVAGIIVRVKRQIMNNQFTKTLSRSEQEYGVCPCHHCFY